ncbi:hypothetical protein Z951_24390 [Streptomyces sp. PRh5]|uniref:hypothetical protein n=1 Tax=Streptomyces sp. PRh5 TaxID=1158056 RepID=UPI000448EA77|nr:hypothetical protein [Streptomyces sp. PRh5]EXU65648.1 hypothetical protein Z951_24390 [Streptomyces sp. PRh5]
MRSDQQAALAGDLIAMIEALGLDRPVVAVSALDDGLRAPEPAAEHAARFPNLIDDVRLRVGHNPPQEAPGAFADAVARIRLRAGT